MEGNQISASRGGGFGLASPHQSQLQCVAGDPSGSAQFEEMPHRLRGQSTQGIVVDHSGLALWLSVQQVVLEDAGCGVVAIGELDFVHGVRMSEFF